DETLVGNLLWAFEGGGSPRRYRLVAVGPVTRLTPEKRPAPYRGTGLNVHYRPDRSFTPIDVTNFPWFARLRKEQRSFIHGLNRISDRRVIAALKALRREGLADAAEGRWALRVSELTGTEPPKRVLRAIKE